jgi:thiamine-phosphate pyrophosphorylase
MQPPKHLDLSLYLVLDPRRCNGINGIVDTTLQAVENGVTTVQLRAEPDWKKRQWYDAALALKKALTPYGVPLIINDQIDVALAVDADGVHIGQKDLPADIVRRLIGADKWLGLSVSNAAQLAAVPRDIVDYIGVGPVFPTTSKPDADPALGIDVLRTLMADKPCPAVAIGGITRQSAATVMATGVDGIAVVSAICGQPDPSLATRSLYDVIKGW